MPQQTNLNVSPYFDDYDPASDYHKVLFKPGYPVQARELTGLQSILQNQIEKFGQHFFKEGAKVIPGNTGYNQLYYAIQLDNNFQGIPVSAYVDQLIGTKITGLTSGVTAVVDKVLLPEDSERNNLTLYINYLKSNTNNYSTQIFSDGEELTTNITITSGLLGNTSIAPGAPFAMTIANDSSGTGSAFQIQEGVYFIRGNFVTVQTETLILDQYTANPSYRIGLNVSEQIITPDLDETLNDNSQGYNNYSAPGADRLKISTSLFKKSLDDFDDDNFIELATVDNGVLKAATRSGFGVGPNGGVFYEDLTNVLARRTYDESGDYTVRSFNITALDSLNDNIGNRGVFQADQFTPGGDSPSDDLMLYKVSPGKAYVRGYELETYQPTFLDAAKPRTSDVVSGQNIIYNTGPTFKINNVYGSPTVGTGNTYTVSLRDRRVGVSSRSPGGNEIGVARVYDMTLESGSYKAVRQLNEWDISLYDVQTVTNITLNQPTTLSTPTFIKGQNSGATAFLKDSVTAGAGLTVYQQEGNFIPNEALSFNGIKDGRVALAITAHTINDVKSIFATDDGAVGSAKTFSADIIQKTEFAIGIATISAQSGGVCTITAANPSFVGLVTTGDLVEFTDGAIAVDPIYGRITGITVDPDNEFASTVSIVGVHTSSGIVAGDLPTAVTTLTDLKILTTDLAPNTDATLYTLLPKMNISDVDLTNASLSIRKSFTVNITSNKLASAVSCGASESFLAFDEERYSLIRSDGNIEPLDAADFQFSDARTLQIYNLGSDDVDAQLLTTVKQDKPKAKEKILQRVNSLIVDKSSTEGSGIGTTTFNDGLTYGSYPWGTRVQDEEISLNTPDVINIHGVFESSDTGNPSAPKMVLGSLTSNSTTTSELIVGEQMVGQISNAVAIVAEKIANSASQIAYIYKNSNLFKEGEEVKFQESNVKGTITTLSAPSFDVSPNFKFTTGQESTFYDFGTIKRNADTDAPKKRLKIYFTSGYYESTDDGDITTVNSYRNFNYATEIKSINGVSNADIIDIRPRVSDYTTAESSRSPLEFYGRSFDGAGNSAGSILASDESINVTYSHYLGRIDRIFLTKDGKLQVNYGQPAEMPERPSPVDDAIELATITLPPYLYNVSQANIRFMEHKRYRMKDIKKLENRIKNLEYYTALSLLETNTANMFVPDGDGLNRFKSGFFVDNFDTIKPQEEQLRINNSIDRSNKQLRPRHYTNAVDLMFGPVTNIDPTADLAFSDIEGLNVRKASDTITLDYSEIEYIKQSFATRSESVTPFLISFWQGTMELTPSSDTWVDTNRLEAKIIETEGNFNETMANAVRTMNVDPQTGFAPVVWDSWQTNWTGTTSRQWTQTSTTVTDGPRFGVGGWINGGSGVAQWQVERTTTTNEDTIQETIQTGVESRTGLRTVVTEQWDNESVGDRVVSRDLVPFCRSRNITFESKKMKPLTRCYGFFDGEDVTKYCVPKLLEISMKSGTFQVGERVVGRIIPSFSGGPGPTVTFYARAAQPNHKEGPYNIPTKIFPESPYTGQPVPSTYSSTSDILNIDLYSMSNEAQGEYYGWVETDMTLKGETSGAEATITNLRLISDIGADLFGSFYLPEFANEFNHPRFETGTKSFVLVDDQDNNQDECNTVSEETYTASGTLETVQENIISVRNARLEQRQEFQERNVNRSLGTEVVDSNVVGQTNQDNVVGWYDPLAQSFLIEDTTGVFITKCDVFFRSKDDMDIPLVFQIRSMKNGFPTQHILPFSEIVLSPDDITTSSDGSVATTIEFKAPVYCEGGQEYAIALASNSTKYSVYISRIGEQDLITQTYISNQPYLGSLFKSQNASTWEASQWEDLKFTLYRADFVDEGTVEFYNPQLTKGNKQIPKLMPNPLELVSKEVRVGLGTTTADSTLKRGNTVYQMGTLATGNLAGTAGTAAGPALNVINAGLGYSPIDGTKTFSGVNLVTITGNGYGAQADIYISSGTVGVATLVNGGTGYQVGDVVGFTTLGLNSVGRGARLSVVSIGNTSELVLDSVQGEFLAGAANTMMYVQDNGTVRELNYEHGGDVTIDSTFGVRDVIGKDGLHVKVNHQNHGMYFNDNQVEISGVESDVVPTKLSVAYNLGDTGSISVQDASEFSTFENVGVGTTNTGFLRIGEEIIEYTEVSGNIIGGNIVRTQSVVGSGPAVSYPAGTPVYKYELGGVNLARINKTHALSDVTLTDPIDFDSYHIKLDMSTKWDNSEANDDRSNDTGFPKLFVNNVKSAGGFNAFASQNMPFEIITPQVHSVTVQGTTLTGELRSTTSKSMSGNEIPWIDNGFESISLNESNYLSSPRLIASKVNEDAKLTTIPGNKSMQMRLFLNTVDSRLTPVVDSQRVNTILTSNRVNSIIDNYATDDRANSAVNDPTACRYISKEITLENNATSLKIIVDAHIHQDADIRAFYAISDRTGFEPIFIPFPGFKNINQRGEIIQAENSDGRPDKLVPKDNDYGFDDKIAHFSEYTFTEDDLPSFRSYRIKIVLTSKSQVFVPRLRDLRVLALA